MSGTDLTGISAARDQILGAQQNLRAIDVQIADATREHAALMAAGDTGLAATTVEERMRDLAQARERAADDHAQLVGGLGSLSDQIIHVLGSPEDAIAALDGATPVALLPLRIETMFDDPRTLRVRVFPDQLHVSAHDDALTDAEVDAGRQYWLLRWTSLGDTVLAADAWARMCAGFRPGRARFVVDAMTPTNQPPDAPAFPDPTRRARGFSAAPSARALPDRVCVLGFRRTAEGQHSELFRVWATKPVPDVLAVGPSSDGITTDDLTGLPSDPAIAWLHDPATAEAVGLLMTITDADVHGATLASGVDRLLAVGVDWTRTPEQSATELAALLTAQNAEGDLRFVATGTPTNATGPTPSGFVTPEAARAGHDPAAPRPTLDDGSGARVMTRALGLAADALDTVPGAALREQRWQQRLAEALWRVGPGYYLTDMLEGLGVDRGTDDALRDFVASYVRPGGALPVVCSGRQPYGFLPVVARRRYVPGRSRAEQLTARVAGVLREIAEPLVAQVPTLADAADVTGVDDTIARLLQRTPVPMSLDFRGAIGPVEVKAMSVYWDRVAAFQQDWNATIWARLHQYTVTRLSELTLDKASHPLDVPLVLKDGGTAYLGDMLALLDRDDAEAQLRLRENSVALLEALLAASAAYEYQYALKRLADPVLVAERPDLAARVTIPTPDSARIEPAQQLSPVVAAVQSSVALAEVVLPQVDAGKTLSLVVAESYSAWRVSGRAADTADRAYRLARWSEAVQELETAPADQLEWAFRAHLDAFSSRLDAWFTALATARLDTHRSSRPAGVHIGAWGWLEGLQPRQGQPRSLGYVHTPSIAHATTAALLRSGRQAHGDASGSVFDVDLSSRRTKAALQVLRGVAQGQRLAALLGYRAERGLQDAGPTITRYVWTLRAAFPLRHTETLPDHPAESIAARDVVDGVALLDRWHDDRDAVLAAGKIDVGDRPAVSAVLDATASLYDAVSDVLVAEAVHQTAQGNLDRAGAALAAHDRQSAAPAPDVTSTPRPGASVTHRVGVLLQDDGPADGWTADVRSVAEPRLDRWLGQVLGPASGFSVTARLVRASGEATPLDPVSLDTLGLGASSVVLAAIRPGEGRASELESVLAAHLASSVGDAGPDDRIELLAEGAAADPERGLGLLLALTSSAGEVLRSPALSGTDLRASGDTVSAPDGTPMLAAVPDADELKARATAVLDALTERLDKPVTGLQAATTDRDVDRIWTALVALAPFDPSALPSVAADSDGALPALLDQATSVGTALAARRDAAVAALAAITIPTAPADASDPAYPAYRDALPQTVDLIAGVVRSVLGQAQPVLPLLTLAQPGAASASLAAAATLTGDDPLAVVEWLHRSALVHPSVDKLAVLLMHAEADGADVHEQLRLVQAPFDPKARWVALPFGEAGAPPHGAACFVGHATHAVDPTQPLAGIVVDAWTETIPEAVETTALTLHVDAPGSRPPQSVLLAVHPAVVPTTWDFDTLVDTVHEAADLARLRTLTTAELTPLGGFLPAWYLPDCYTRDVPSVPLRGLREHAYEVGLSRRTTILGKG